MNCSTHLADCAYEQTACPGMVDNCLVRAGLGRITPMVIPPAELAIIRHYGSLSNADLSYATLGSYATAHEISVDGPLREYYLRGASDTPDQAEWRTEIGWPIFRADGAS